MMDWVRTHVGSGSGSFLPGTSSKPRLKNHLSSCAGLQTCLRNTGFKNPRLGYILFTDPAESNSSEDTVERRRSLSGLEI